VRLDQVILMGLREVDLKGMTVLSVALLPDGLRVVFAMPPAEVEFTINDDDQFKILSVIYNGVTYDDPAYLSQFDAFALDIVTHINLIKKKQIKEKLQQNEAHLTLTQSRLEALLLREEKIQEQAQQLDLKEQEIRTREKTLSEKEAVIALKREEEASKREAGRLKNRENNVNALIQKFRKKKEVTKD